MTTRRRRSEIGWVVPGVILVVVGGFFALTNIFGVDLSWDVVWPLLILGLGVFFLVLALRPGETPEPHT